MYVAHILKTCINEGKKGEPWRRFIYLRTRSFLFLEFIASSIALSQRRRLRCGPAEAEASSTTRRACKNGCRTFSPLLPCVKWLGLSSPVYQGCITASSSLLLHLFVGL